MPVGYYNRDSSFFEIDSTDVKLNTEDLSDWVSAFTVEETLQNLLTGSISFYDPDGYFSSTMKMGKKMDLTWGYKKIPLLTPFPDPDEMLGDYTRKNIPVIIMGPSGSGSEQGAMMFNCNFISADYQVGRYNKQYAFGNKKLVVSLVMQRMGVEIPFQFINFKKGSDNLSTKTAVFQHKNDFKFLVEKSFEWRAVFKIATTSAGIKIGLFADWGTPEMKDFSKLAAQAVSGNSITLDYMEETSPLNTIVKSYTWSQEGTGSGDNVTIYMDQGGKPQFRFTKTTTEKTYVYKFHPEKMAAELKIAGSPAEKTRIVSDWIATQNFDTLVGGINEKGKYFTLETETTAPQGVGWKIQAKCLGNALLTSPMRVNFGKPVSVDPDDTDSDSLGFPDQFKTAQANFWLNKVTHTISRSGYECDLDIVDAFTLSGGSMI